MRICCIWLVDSVKSMMMHGLSNPKFNRIPSLLVYVHTQDLEAKQSKEGGMIFSDVFEGTTYL